MTMTTGSERKAAARGEARTSGTGGSGRRNPPTFPCVSWVKETRTARHFQGQKNSCCWRFFVTANAWRRRVRAFHQLPFNSSLKSFSRVSALGHRARSNQSHAGRRPAPFTPRPLLPSAKAFLCTLSLALLRFPDVLPPPPHPPSSFHRL